MKLYAARITDRFGTWDCLFRAVWLPTDRDIRRCLRLLPDTRIEVQYLGDAHALPVVSESGPAPVMAPGRASR